MIRLWIKFKEQSGKKVIDRATFQSFGCETAIAVASLATELIRGKTAEEVLAMSADQLAPGLGPLPPVQNPLHPTGGNRPALRPAAASPPRKRAIRLPRSRPRSQPDGQIHPALQPAAKPKIVFLPPAPPPVHYIL